MAEKSKRQIIRELQADLAYHQMMLRVDWRVVVAGTRKCQELRARINELQNYEPTSPETVNDEEAYQIELEMRAMYYPENPPSVNCQAVELASPPNGARDHSDCS